MHKFVCFPSLAIFPLEFGCFGSSLFVCHRLQLQVVSSGIKCYNGNIVIEACWCRSRALAVGTGYHFGSDCGDCSDAIHVTSRTHFQQLSSELQLRRCSQNNHKVQQQQQQLLQLVVSLDTRSLGSSFPMANWIMA